MCNYNFSRKHNICQQLKLICFFKAYFYPVKKYCSLDVSLQDAHNCILDFDEDTAMFAVYDGHGGKSECKLVYLTVKTLFCCF